MDEDFKKKLKIMILVLGTFLLILLVFFLLSYYRKPTADNTQQDDNNTLVAKPAIVATNTTPVSNKTTVKKIAPVAPRKLTKVDIEKMASSFAERFGTYSNQANFSNMVDLKIFMSRNMQIWADAYVLKQSKNNNDIYYGVTTKAATAEATNFNEESDRATVLVQTRRREATMSTTNVAKVFTQNITVNLIKEDNAWKIDSVYWQ